MRLTLTWGEEPVVIETTERIELSQPLGGSGPVPGAFGIPPLESRPFRIGGFVGNTGEGGPCNVSVITFTPHGNGTHTESIGHVVHETVPVPKLLTELLVPALVIRVAATKGSHTAEGYTPSLSPDDWLITREALTAEGTEAPPPGGALVVLTGAEPGASFSSESSPFFTHEAMQWMVERGVRHLMVDTPSVDRLEDEGLLSNHRLFWGLPPGSTHLADAQRPEATITEWLAPATHVLPGRYFAAIEAPALQSDAAPTRVFLYPFRRT